MARDYALVKPQFWIGKTGRAIKRAGKDARIVADYLVGGPHSNLIGLYYLHLVSISNENPVDHQEAVTALLDLANLGFAHYDHEAEVVWVVTMARFQMNWKGDRLKASDKRIQAAQREYREVADNVFLGPFFDAYHVALHLTERRGAPAERGPLEAPSGETFYPPSKGHPNSLPDQEQDQEHDQEHDHGQEHGQEHAQEREQEREEEGDELELPGRLDPRTAPNGAAIKAGSKRKGRSPTNLLVRMAEETRRLGLPIEEEVDAFLSQHRRELQHLGLEPTKADIADVLNAVRVVS